MFENIPKIPQRVKFFRIMKGISQEKMSRAVGKSHTYINLLENGAKKPKTATIVKICEFFDISIKEFFDFNIDEVEKAGLLQDKCSQNNLKERQKILQEGYKELCANNNLMLL